MNNAGAVTLARVQERLDRFAAEIRVDGDRVGERRPTVARLHVRGRVRTRRRADVAALRIGDHEQTRLARVQARVLERAQSVRTERLEERELRLDGDAHRRRRVDQPPAETGNRIAARGWPFAGLSLQLDRHEVEHGIEPEHELTAPAFHALRHTIGEHAGHRLDLGHVGSLRCLSAEMLRISAAETGQARLRRACPIDLL